MDLGTHLRNARNECELTQRDVEKYTHISYKTLSNWENNVSRPNPDDLKTLSNLYGLSIDQLVGNTYVPKHHATGYLERYGATDAFKASPSEQALLQKYRTLTDEQQGMINNQLDYLCGLNETKQQESAS